jgi:hypothetical protein
MIMDPRPFIDQCENDVCNCGTLVNTMEAMERCQCLSFAAYARECAIRGMVLDWRSEKLCGMNINCDKGMIYKECGSNCGRMCRRDTEPPFCREECVEGCACPQVS